MPGLSLFDLILDALASEWKTIFVIQREIVDSRYVYPALHVAAVIANTVVGTT